VDATASWLDQNGAEGSTLKVFVVPEYYFRPLSTTSAPYLNNSYSAVDYQRIRNTLNVMFRSPDFTDWLFICGSVVWRSSAPLPTDTPLPTGSGMTTYRNTALVVRGGPGPNGKGWPDELVWKVTSPPADAFPSPSWDDPQLRAFFESWPGRKSRLFYIDEVSVGLEIGTDHDVGRRLREVVTEQWDEKQPVEPAGVDLHIVIGAGIEPDPEAAAARVRGYLLYNDGWGEKSGVMGHVSELWRINDWPADPNYAKYFPDYVPGPQLADLAPLPDKRLIPGVHNIRLSGAAVLPTPPGFMAGVTEQRVVVYPRSQL
jgi:hypothetical protein